MRIFGKILEKAELTNIMMLFYLAGVVSIMKNNRKSSLSYNIFIAFLISRLKLSMQKK